MSKRLLLALVTVIAVCGLLTDPVAAQPPTRNEVLEDIKDIETLDPDLERYLPRWKVQEADLKIKLSQLFRLEGMDVSETDSFVIIASFPRGGKQDLLVIRAGDSPDAMINGSDKILASLGTPLYNELLARNYAFTDIPPATPLTTTERDRVPSVLQPTNAQQFVAVSAFRQAVQIGTTGARIEHQLGNDEIGYHFWSSGQGKVLLSYPIIRLEDAVLRSKGVPDIFTLNLGIAYRLKVGAPDDAFLGGLISPRLLNGSVGGKGIVRMEYRIPQLNDIGFSFNAELPFERVDSTSVSRGGLALIQERRGGRTLDSFEQASYHLRTVAQGGVFWENWLDDYEHFFRISVGVSYQEVLRYVDVFENKNPFEHQLRPTRLYHPTDVKDWIYARIEYLNQSGYPFGISAQLANQNLMVSAFAPVLPNWLFLEVKVSTPVLRKAPQPWEQQPFVMISPILRIKLD